MLEKFEDGENGTPKIDVPVTGEEVSINFRTLTPLDIQNLQLVTIDTWSNSSYVQDRLRVEQNHLETGLTRPGGRVYS